MTTTTSDPAAPVMMEHLAWMMGYLEEKSHQTCATQPSCQRCPLQLGCKL